MRSLDEIIGCIDGSMDDMVETMIGMIRIPALAPINGGDGESRKADYLMGKLEGFDSIQRVDVPDSLDPSVMRSNILAKKNGKKPNGSKPGFGVYYTNDSLVIDSDISDLKTVEDK